MQHWGKKKNLDLVTLYNFADIHAPFYFICLHTNPKQQQCNEQS